MRDLSNIKALAMDVDGVLTDGVMAYAPDGIIKNFHVADGVGLRLAQAVGLKTVWITGNTSPTVAERAADLKIDMLFQNARFKAAALDEVCGRFEISCDQIAYMGDDLNDLPAFDMVGVRFAPANAVPEVKNKADFIMERAGGWGAVREMVEMVLKAQNRWEESVEAFLDLLKREQARDETSGVVA